MKFKDNAEPQKNSPAAGNDRLSVNDVILYPVGWVHPIGQLIPLGQVFTGLMFRFQ